MNINTFLRRLFTTSIFTAYISVCLCAQDVLVSSRNSNSVKQFDLATGSFLGDFVEPGSGNLSLPQEVVWHPDGFLLVTGRGNTAVKKYDGITGDYLGDFTSGYVLDNPTKTTIWRDSLLFVSQWGTAKNKVVRFDLKTGAFVDEFTSIGVPNGCGHAWDTAGNLYMAQYGNGANGQVLKFDPNGMSAGAFIPTTILQGPVNIWFDSTGQVFVADWTLGAVLQFNGATGNYQSKLVEGLANVEGYAFDNQGRLYLCDWSANKVFRYDFETDSLTPFIQAGGLMAPNSILIREHPAAGSHEISGNFRLAIYPNPADSFVQVGYTLRKTARVRVEVLNTLGQHVTTLFSGNQLPGEHQLSWNGLTTNGARVQAGVYFVRLVVGTEVVEKKLVWQ